MPPNLDFRAGPLLPHQWASAGMLSPHDRERGDRRFDSASSTENMKAADGPSSLVSTADSFSDLSRAYQSMMGNGVHFQGSLQAFMDSFVLSSMKKDLKDSHSPAQLQVHYHDNGEPKAKRAISAEQEREEKVEAKQNSEPGKPGSQYEPLDLSVSVRPESASGSLPGSSVTIHDNVAWHGCLFCSFSTSSFELMALHLQANHLGKALPPRSDTGKEPHGEASPTTSTIHSSNKNCAMALDKDGDKDGEKNQGGWNNHIDQPYNPFQSDFYRRFGGLYDGSPRANQVLQGYVAPEEHGLDLPSQTFIGASSTADDQIGESGSCGDAEDDQVGSDDEVVKAGQCSASETPSTTPKRQPQQNHSDEEEEEGGVAEEEEERDDHGPMDMEAEDEESPASDHLQNLPKQLQDESPLATRSGGGLAASSSSMKPLSLVPQTKNQALVLEKQWQQGLGLLSHGGPPGLLKVEQQNHLEQQMNMLSVLRAYSNDNLPAFNGLGGGASTVGMKRPEAPGECL